MILVINLLPYDSSSSLIQPSQSNRCLRDWLSNCDTRTRGHTVFIYGAGVVCRILLSHHKSPASKPVVVKHSEHFDNWRVKKASITTAITAEEDVSLLCKIWLFRMMAEVIVNHEVKLTIRAILCFCWYNPNCPVGVLGNQKRTTDQIWDLLCT